MREGGNPRGPPVRGSEAGAVPWLDRVETLHGECGLFPSSTSVDYELTTCQTLCRRRDTEGQRSAPGARRLAGEQVM